MSGIRVGQGIDLHRFAPDGDDRPLVLGGLRFEGPGLVGHSDGDAVCHALADALLSAGGLPDIGQLFSDEDDRWAGADSTDLLAEVVERVAGAGWVVVNAVCTLVTDEPRIASRRAEMEEQLTALVGAPVTVGGRRPEGLGAVGRREGLLAMAVALLEAAP